MRPFACLIAAVALAASLWPRSDAAAARRDASIPRLVLWAWERPEDLSFVDPAQVGVAFLAKTIHVEPGGIRVRPRRQPLAVPSGTKTIAVVRLETRTAPTATQRARVLTEVLATSRNAALAAVQIDFDARQSERAWYRELLAELRASLPAALPLSMTALASWCVSDDWIGDLAADEVVPMAFRMGPDAARVRAALADAGRFPARRCRSSIGLATDEPVPATRRPSRVYLFHPASAWNEVSFREARAQIGW